MKKILVVDDDNIVVSTIKNILSREGYDVSSVSNGEECLKKILLDMPDLILLDIIMPKMDGHTFLVSLKELRALSGEPLDIPAIVITAREDDLARELMTKEKVRDYLVKPFELKELVEKVKKVIG